MNIDLSEFDTIIFDFGGVILDIDPQRTINSFLSLAKNSSLDSVYESGIIDEFEKGQISAEILRSKLGKLLDINITNEVFDRAWCAILMDFKRKRIERIQWLKNTHQLILLSNTNEIHFNHFSAKLKDEYGLLFSDLFSSVYLSYEMGLLKPDKEIFRQVLIKENLNPEKTLFIEDTVENAEAAKQLGIETLIIPRNGSFYDYFL